MSLRAALLAGAISLIAIPAMATPVTYTWENLSSTDTFPFFIPFQLSFTVDSDVTVNANSSFASIGPYDLGPNPQVAYPFPSQITAFFMTGAGTLASFLSPDASGDPRWTFDLTADTKAETASLSLFFDGENTDINSGAPFGPVLFSTGQISTVSVASDDNILNGKFTGMLVATPNAVPEPTSLKLLLTSIVLMICVSELLTVFSRPRTPDSQVPIKSV